QLVTECARRRDAAHRSGQRAVESIVTWTLNDADEWKVAVGAGSNAILTNNPATLRRWSNQDPHGYVPPDWPRPRGSTQTSDSGYAVGPKGVMGFVGDALKSISLFFSGLFG